MHSLYHRDPSRQALITIQALTPKTPFLSFLVLEPIRLYNTRHHLRERPQALTVKCMALLAGVEQPGDKNPGPECDGHENDNLDDGDYDRY